jgi:hypothetical protein
MFLKNIKIKMPLEFRRANSSLPAQQPTKGRPIRPAAHPRSALWRLAQAAGAVTLSGRHHRPSVSSPSTSSAALPENPNPPHHHISPLSLSIQTPPRPHHITSPPPHRSRSPRLPARRAGSLRMLENRQATLTLASSARL